MSGGRLQHGQTRDEQPRQAPAPGRSLIERLFPERYASASQTRDPTREIPSIPAEAAPTSPRGESHNRGQQDTRPRLRKGEVLRRAMQTQDPDTAVLVLRDAGKNLTEEDFRRVIPQGRHLEGWTLEQGDILRTVPGRDLETLEPNGSYYLLFSSPLSAFTYQGHVTRVYRMAVANSPSYPLSPLGPPPGYMLEGMDAHDAINSFTLLPPGQSLQLRQLKPPLAPFMASIVKHGGYEPLMARKDRMPHEARMTLEGPQLQLATVRHILRASGRDRGRSWSGDENDCPKLSQWTPLGHDEMPSPANRKETAVARDRKRGRDAYRESFPSEPTSTGTEDDGLPVDKEMKRRTIRPTYIAGFATEQALYSFIHFWHGRTMSLEGSGQSGWNDEWDAPPVAHVEVLW